MTKTPIIMPPANTHVYAAARQADRHPQVKMCRKRFALNIAIGMLLASLIEWQLPGPSLIAAFFGF